MAYQRFDGYRPREDGTPSGTAGPKRAWFERVEWKVIPDASTAAAAMQNNQKTVVMSGDGGFYLNMGELWTAVQEDLDMVVMVMNDNGYGVIKRIQDHTAQGRRYYADLQGPALEKLAALSDIPFFKVERAEDFGAAMAKALAVKGLTMVEVDMTSVGEFPPYYPFNIRPGG